MKKWIWAPVAISMFSGITFYQSHPKTGPKIASRGIAMLINHNLSLLPFEKTSQSSLLVLEKEVDILKSKVAELQQIAKENNDKIIQLSKELDEKIRLINEKIAVLQQNAEIDKSRLDLALVQIKKIQEELDKLKVDETVRLAKENKRLEEEAKKKDQELENQREEFEKRIAALECKKNHQVETPVEQVNKIVGPQAQILAFLQQNQNMAQMMNMILSMNSPINSMSSPSFYGYGSYGQKPFSLSDIMGGQYNNYGYGQNFNMYGQQQQPVIINNYYQYPMQGMGLQQGAQQIQQPGWQQWQATPDNITHPVQQEFRQNLFNFGDAPVHVDSISNFQTVA